MRDLALYAALRDIDIIEGELKVPSSFRYSTTSTELQADEARMMTSKSSLPFGCACAGTAAVREFVHVAIMWASRESFCQQATMMPMTTKTSRCTCRVRKTIRATRKRVTVLCAVSHARWR